MPTPATDSGLSALMKLQHLRGQQRYRRCLCRCSQVPQVPSYARRLSYRHAITMSLRWRVQLMERGIALIDFVNVDSMVQVHGSSSAFPAFLCQLPDVIPTDYEGVGLGSRDANSKAAAGQASKIFQDYYPEFLVRVLGSPYRYPSSSLRSSRSSSSTFRRS